MRKRLLQLQNIYLKYTAIYTSMDTDIKRALGTGFSAVLGSVFTVIKLLIGIVTFSIIFIYSCAYAVLLILCKFLFIINQHSEKEEKYRAYKRMSLLLLAGAIVFNLGMLIRLNLVHTEHRYHPIIAVIFSFYLIFSYITGVYGLFDAKKQKELLFTGLRIVNYSSFFMNLVLAQRLIIGCLNISDRLVTKINFAVGISCGTAMAVLAASMYFYGKHFYNH